MGERLNGDTRIHMAYLIVNGFLVIAFTLIMAIFADRIQRCWLNFGFGNVPGQPEQQQEHSPALPQQPQLPAADQCLQPRALKNIST